MSLYAIHQYHAEVEKLIHYGGSSNEMSVRNAFSRLLDYYAQSRDLKLVPEVSIKTKEGKIIRPDGTLKDMLRLDHGYWESKDGKDDINEEIRKKLNKGYPFENTLFEDSTTAILFQNNTEVLRVPMSDGVELDKMLNTFVNFERQEVKQFHKAIELFKQDIPKVTQAIHQVIADQKNNLEFKEALHGFYLICQQAINSSITIADINEMLVQHILSADIFNTIFDEPHFHQENNIARELNKVIESFFFGTTRRSALNSIKHYYDTINAAAASIADHHEKQKFLKVVYENFYKAYNPKAADKLGIVYTPNEIVKFMIKSTDFLLHRHFGKALADKDVEILDPATGTGTFMCDIIDHLRAAGPKKLEYKYKHELHANEVAILPYYIANLNIEYTYKQATGKYAEFENLCFVDTLDNTGYGWQGKQTELFGLSTENVARIKKQNNRKISVIIGNPPYNVGQQNENEDNKNREYPVIDTRIKDTFIKNSTAQKTKMYDMYSRFYRWAMDRVDENGIIAFITNRSFIESRTFDGFRKCIQTDFGFGYIIDTKSDVRANPKLSGSIHNVFGIQAGVAIIFLVKVPGGNEKGKQCRIQYVAMEDEWKKEKKLQWLIDNPMEKIDFTTITPDKTNNWINGTDNDFESLLPLCEKNKSSNAVFNFYANGVATGRDEWNYDLDPKNLAEKARYFIDVFNKNVRANNAGFDLSIKWTETLKGFFKKRKALCFRADKIVKSNYRPFVKQHFYSEKILSDRLTENHFQINGNSLGLLNKTIVFTSPNSQKPFLSLITNNVVDWHFVGPACGSICLPFKCYQNGEAVENITDWSLQKFQIHYNNKRISKESIFHYVYAVLHCPTYLKKYELNLKREFPRIPFYDDFQQWQEWGKQLIELHLNYESSVSYRLQRKETAKKELPKAKLKAVREKGIIQLDENTELHGIPEQAWEYKLGNRSALEWVLDQYKESKPKDTTIAKKFNNYCFKDYKEEVIDLIKKICTVSIRTMEVVNAMQ